MGLTYSYRLSVYCIQNRRDSFFYKEAVKFTVGPVLLLNRCLSQVAGG